MGLFYSDKPGKGISKEDVDKSGIPLYFDIFFRRFWKLITINLLYMVASIPAIVIGFFIANYLMGSVLSFIGVTADENIYAMMAILAVPFTTVILQATGSGPATVAMNYVLGKYVKDTHSWVWSDFFENIKRNFLQGMAVYIINTVVFLACAFSFLFYNFVMTGTMAGVLKIVIMVFSVIFFIMQFYTYRLVAEFELKVKHVYKNALILTIVGMKWNLFAAIVIIALMCMTYALLAEFFVIGFLVIAVFYFSLFTFTQLFITNNVVKKYLLEPSLQMQNQQEDQEKENEE